MHNLLLGSGKASCPSHGLIGDPGRAMKCLADPEGDMLHGNGDSRLDSATHARPVSRFSFTAFIDTRAQYANVALFVICKADDVCLCWFLSFFKADAGI